MQRLCSLAVGVAVLLIGAAAAADPIFGTDDPPRDSGTGKPRTRADTEHWRPGFGARVGGYGFAHPDGKSSKWDDCRMNGFGAFGTLDVNRYFFGELSLDFYRAAPDVAASGMDRVSTHSLVAAGVRMFPDFVLTPYVQVGGGAEWTRVDLGGGRTEQVYPMAFVGIGAALRVTRELEVGSNFRMLASMQPDPSTEREPGAPDPMARRDVPMMLGYAAQGQFFARYAL